MNNTVYNNIVNLSLESERDSMDLKTYLTEVTAISGTPGFERPVAEYIAKVFEPLADEVTIDQFSNVIARKGQNGPRFILCAHEDEIGMVVRDIEKDGSLRITGNGGVDPRILPAMEVNVITKDGPLYGVIGAKSPHLLTAEERSKAPAMSDMYVDLGFGAEEVKKRVRIGDPVVMIGKTVELADGRMAGKTMDDRACVATMVECIEHLNRMNAPAQAFMVSTTKEEVGGYGASMSTYRIDPDVAIVVDVTHGEGPGTGKFEAFPLDKPTIAVGPNLHPMLTKKLREVAKKHHVEYNVEVASGVTGTDAADTQVVRAGVPSVLISVPLKYMHTTVETLSLDVIRETGRLMAHFIDEISREWEDLKWY